ncbi:MULTISPECIES: AfsR/SARP family transcriptional regulator [Streptomyces griseus group]|uniref:AfsR/SARP family transcriptional regulator n=1 Tax=Streptomyces griseus group TaxID=629295 RepID=UPI0005178CF1|nr:MULTISPECIES: AfsR/SARP family transcriptional regulator [Streptomyces griseus group]MCX4710394.1 winged helix-turn-helix domain-containing protein [Streptomyces griseus]
MDFGVLGPLTVRRAGVPLELGTPKGQMLLAVLLSRPGRTVTDDALVEAVWGAEQPKSATKNVQTYVHRLRRRLGDPGRITREGRGYRLRADRGELDSARFEDLANAARAASAAGDHERSRRLFDEALGLWRGPAFGEIADVPALRAEATRLDELRLGVLEERVDVDLRLGRHGEVLGELTALTMEHPFRERMWAQLMLALYRCGRRADALLAYLQVRDVLVEETGLEPGHRLRNLHRAVLDEDPALDRVTAGAEARAPGRTAVTTPGPTPDRMEVAADELAPRRTAFAADDPAQRPVPDPAPGRPALVSEEQARADVARARMLPPALGDFSGQERELAEIEAVLRTRHAADEPAATVTVSGPGGVGKTALAVQAAHRLRSAYPDGRLFAALAGSRTQPASATAVLGRFLRALGVPATAVPDDPEERVDLYRGLLAERRILVVLDDAYNEAQLAPLLPPSGTCGVIATGRVRLGGLGGAHRVELREMSEADSAALLRGSTGGRLATASGAELSELVRLCARLPLALRIAGSLLVSRPHWRPADLVSRLADEQHRLDALRYRDLEVRASFGLSYEGLRPGARRLFRLLGLLEAPDFPLWAAAAAVDTELREAQELLDELVDVHLLDVRLPDASGTPYGGQARYAFHDLIRAYARERADAEETAAARDGSVVRVLGALLAFTDIADRDHMGQNMFQQDADRWEPARVEAGLPTSVPPMELLDAERASLMAGVRQAAELGRDELCWELAVGGHVLFETERYFDDWQECYDTAMGLARAAGNLRGRARLLISMAGLLYTRRRYGPAEESNTEAMGLFERIGDRRGYLEALSNAPFFLVPNGRLTEAITAGREAYERLDAGGQAAAALHAYSQVGLAHLQAGRPERAVAVLTEIVAGARKQGIRTLIARDTYWLGQAQLALGRHQEAEESFAELTECARGIGASGPFYTAHAWGCLHLARGEFAEARSRLLEGVEVARALHDPMFETRVLVDLLDARLYELHDGQDAQDGHDAPALAAAIVQGEHAVAVARGIDYPYLLAGVLEKLARLRAAAGDPGGAKDLDDEAAALRDTIH